MGNLWSSSGHLRGVVFIAATGVAAAASAGSATVSSVSELPGAIVLDVAQGGTSDPFGPFVFGGGAGVVTATAVARFIATGTIQDPPMLGFFNRSSTCNALPGRCGTIDPAVNPGDWRGRADIQKDLIITFDQPVAGFGVSLYINGTGDASSTGSVITAYDGPGGTGNPLVTVVSPDSDTDCCPISSPPPWYFIVFRGVTSDAGEIRSVVIEPTVPANGWGIDALAVAPSAGPAGCNAADLAEPFGLLDLADVNAFASAFLGGDPLADLDGSGLLDLSDVNLFVSAFVSGCP
jgi:hypothetical protein